ncbi:MAG: shikimate kinase [Nonlabens sp.]|uniref:shikimate kinase n=1 Tax=Nonlabens sp. TaxID=1888209 RepID=UPI00321B8BD2
MAFKIILLGYMGSGKSTVSKELAKKLQVSSIDLDDEIENFEKSTIPQIFDSKGAIYFRKLEKTVLDKIIERDDSFVLSLGGGTPCYFNNMKFLNNREEVLTIYLDVNISTLIKRLKDEVEHRPILNNINSAQELTEFIGKHLFERRPFYNQAKERIQIVDESTEQIIEKIIPLLF